jgi:hypothetical protein
MIVVGELKGGDEKYNTVEKVSNLHSLMNINSRDSTFFPDGKNFFEMNDLSSDTSVYQYTFNNKVAGCQKCKFFLINIQKI